MKLLIVRHGETDWNVDGRLQGQTDIELNDKGREMARQTGIGMKDVHIDLCYSSPLKRAYETAELMLAGRDIEIRTDDRLKEASFGKWEGLICKAEGYNVPLKSFSTYWLNPESPEIDESVERLPQLAIRVEDFFRDLVSDESLKDKTILITLHGCVLRAILYLIEGKKPFAELKGSVPFNCEVLECDAAMENGELIMKDMGRSVYYDDSLKFNYYATMAMAKTK
ncbi:MAG: histidine phosphatase family protein [Eubacteriales bacterium]|nr:histidine phosphatase family protein [Eubacteriales bacterium]